MATLQLQPELLIEKLLTIFARKNKQNSQEGMQNEKKTIKISLKIELND